MFRIVVVRTSEQTSKTEQSMYAIFFHVPCMLRFRPQWSEPAGRRVRQRAAAARLDAAEDHRAGALRRQAL